MKYFPRVLQYLKPYWALAAFASLIIVLGSATGLLAPWPLKILVDNILGNHPLPGPLASLPGVAESSRITLMIIVVAAGLGLSLFENALTVLGSYLHTKLEQHMILDFRSDLFQHAQRLSLAFHDRRRSGTLIYAINYQADAAARLVMIIPPIAQSVLTLVGMFWITFKMDGQLALISLIVLPFLYLSVNYYATHIQERLREVLGMEGESLSIIHEAMSMLRVIVAFGREQHEYLRFRDQGKRTVDARVKLTVRQTIFSLAVNMITATGTALVLGFGVYRVMTTGLTTGDLLVVMAYIASVYKPLETISLSIGSLQDSIAALRLAFDLLDTAPEIYDAPDAVPLERARGEVEFRNVNFAYAGRVETLKDISFSVEAGRVIAVVGPTGAGKSTLVSLIPRFYEATSGTILVDGNDLRKISLKSLRAQISIVLQEPLLFSGSIADNIRYGKLDATMDEIIASAEAANAHTYIMGLPNKYDTIIGERGAQLSGGERQRISVARAFLKDAPILILDEPTSSIDARTEAVILDALDRLMAGRTTFMIAHRLSTVRKADAILVIDHGKLVEQGTQEELLARGGLFKQLHEMQAGGRTEPVAVVSPDDGSGSDG